MPTSDANTPITTSLQSPDSLPLKGYTIDQLADYIFRQLGSPVWTVEVTRQQVLDCINDALMLYSEWVPLRKVGSIGLVRDRFNYLDGTDVGQGVCDVQFVEQNPVPTELFWGNLISPAPLFRTGLDEYDVFLRWRKTWQRVTSIKPDWFYDDAERILYIHNPIERYHAGVFCYFNHDDPRSLSITGARWVKEFALARARYVQGDIWMKYSGAIPGPVKDMQLDATRRDSADKEIDRLRLQLFGMQQSAGVFVD